MHGHTMQKRPEPLRPLLALHKSSRKSTARKMFTAHSPSYRRHNLGLITMNIRRKKRVLMFLFSFLIDLKILAWPFAFGTIQSHESLMCVLLHRTMHSFSLHQFPACVSVLGPMYRPFEFRDRASPALLSAQCYSLAAMSTLQEGPVGSVAFGVSHCVSIGVLLQLIISICFLKVQKKNS